jgi:uncharacterized membrane protein YphA (DoxX/SURF4 family)
VSGDPAEPELAGDSPPEGLGPGEEVYEEQGGLEPYAAPPPGGVFRSLRDTRVWGLLAIRGYLAFVFFQAALGHLGQSPQLLVAEWSPGGAFGGLGSAAQQNPTAFVELIIGLELALAASVTVGFLTRLAGLAGFLLNGFFFVAFEWGDLSQVYLSWDAGLAALWLVVLLTGPGRYVGLGHYVAERWPRAAPWLV